MSDKTYNGFKALEKDIIENKEQDHFKKVSNNLQENKSTFDFIGNLISLYLPEVMTVLSKIIGGSRATK